tara:strand:- start:714 stop:1205 length:492 start_codon:yes stop_codon:yes gene_type:complete
MDLNDYIHQLLNKEPAQEEYADPRDHRKQQVQEFLKKMSAIESSSGQDLAHKRITNPKSVHYGTAAVGEYGLMPLTAQEMDKRFGVDELKGMDKFEAEKKLNENPELAEQLAKSMAARLTNQHGEGELANYMWQYGHNSPPEDPNVIKKSDRTKKFRVLNKKK